MNPQEQSDPQSIEQLILQDGRYRLEAFSFLHEGLARAVRTVHGQGESSHVTGQQLCNALRDLARQRYGLMSAAVLRRWGIHGSIDFGHMVYLLIEHGLMRKTEEDSVEDFRDQFDLPGDFDTSEEISLDQNDQPSE
jgi:uncharacterized repeat protein (TIGR04138 family)